MSWSIEHEGTYEELPEQLPDELLRQAEAMNAGSTGPARIAWDVALDLIGSEEFGARSKRFYVHLNGHVNPNHEPQEGYVNDYVAINISQR